MIDQNYGDDTVALWCRLSVFDRDVFDAIKSSLLWAAPERLSVVVVFAVKSSAESGPQVRIDRKTMFEHVPLEHRAARYRDVLE